MLLPSDLMATGRAGWPAGRGTAARDRTRQAILETALRLFAERGYIGVRVEDIAREAGVSRATFYKHFAERDEILGSLFERLLDTATEVPAPARGKPESRVRALLDATVDQMLDDEALARFVYSIPLRHDAVLPGGAAVPPVFEEVRAVLEAAAGKSQLRADVPLDRAMELLGRAFEASMRAWASGEVDDPRTRLDELLGIIFRGLSPA